MICQLCYEEESIEGNSMCQNCINANTDIEEEIDFNDMRSFTKKESELYEESLSELFKPTGDNFFDSKYDSNTEKQLKDYDNFFSKYPIKAIEKCLGIKFTWWQKLYLYFVHYKYKLNNKLRRLI